MVNSNKSGWKYGIFKAERVPSLVKGEKTVVSCDRIILIIEDQEKHEKFAAILFSSLISFDAWIGPL